MTKSPTNIICDLSAISLSSKILENVKDRLIYEVSREEFMNLKAYIGMLQRTVTESSECVKEIYILGIKVREKT